MNDFDLFGNPLFVNTDESDSRESEGAKEDQEGRAVYVHFESQEDVEAFTKVIGQVIPPMARSIVYRPINEVTEETTREDQ